MAQYTCGSLSADSASPATDDWANYVGPVALLEVKAAFSFAASRKSSQIFTNNIPSARHAFPRAPVFPDPISRPFPISISSPSSAAVCLRGAMTTLSMAWAGSPASRLSCFFCPRCRVLAPRCVAQLGQFAIHLTHYRHSIHRHRHNPLLAPRCISKLDK